MSYLQFKIYILNYANLRKIVKRNKKGGYNIRLNLGHKKYYFININFLLCENPAEVIL